MAEMLWSPCKMQVCSHHLSPTTFQSTPALKAKTRMCTVAQGAMNGLVPQHLGASPLSPQPFLLSSVSSMPSLLLSAFAGQASVLLLRLPNPYQTGLPTAYRSPIWPQPPGDVPAVCIFQDPHIYHDMCNAYLPLCEPHTGVRGCVCALSQS